MPEAPFEAGVSAPALSFPQGLDSEAKPPRDDILWDGNSYFICSVVAVADSKSTFSASKSREPSRVLELLERQGDRLAMRRGSKYNSGLF